MPLLPTRRTVIALAAIATGASIALLVAKARNWGETPLALVAGVLAGALAVLFLADAAFTAWQLRRKPISFERQMPSAFALGQPHGLVVTLAHEGTRPWAIELFDHVPPTMARGLLPAAWTLPAGSRLDVR